MNLLKEVVAAEARIRKRIRETPLEHSPYLSKISRGQVLLKLENLQITGSFKVRGALNKILSLNDDEKRGGVVTASSGNHGAAFAYILNELDIKGKIYLPESTTDIKLEHLRLHNANYQLHGNDCVKAEAFARRTSKVEGSTFVSPYNDIKIIGGQGTIGLELIRQTDKIDSILVPVGGGGLISGIAGYLKPENESIEIIGCQPVNSAVMYHSIEAGEILEMESKPTISDGSAGGIEKNSITFEFCRQYVDDFILLTEGEIKDAMRLIAERHHLLIEGSAALSVAAFIKDKERFVGKKVVLIISGANIGMEDVKTVLFTDN